MRPTSKRPLIMAMVLGSALALPSASQASEIAPAAVDSISRYCSACWRNARVPVDKWADCTQEVFTRLLQKLPAPNWTKIFKEQGDSRLELMRAIDMVKKRHLRARRFLTIDAYPVVDQHGLEEKSLTESGDLVRQAAGELLSPRQQRLLQMTCEGYSIADMAQELSMSTQRVSDEKYKAIQKLRMHFQQEV